MAKLPCKNLLLVAFFLLCFVTIGAKAGNLKVANDMNEVEKKMKEQEENSFTSKGNEVAPDADELLGMDYTGPKKKPPIHN